MRKWYKLDNAAIIFPATATNYNSSIYRISFILNEEIDATLLQQAVDTTINRFPTLKVEIKSGFFWNFLIKNEKKLIIQEEKNYPCIPIGEDNNNYLIRVLYYKNKIAIEAFHSLTDGLGTIEFLKTLTYQYLILTGKKINHENKILLPDEISPYFEEEDSFKKYYYKKPTKSEKHPRAHRIYGTNFENFGNNVIHGIIDVSELKKISKEKNMTITEFLTTLLIYSIYTETMRYNNSKNPIVITLPVNLRNFFDSKTLRNFFCVINIIVTCKKDMSFDEIGKLVKEEIKTKLDKEYLEEVIIKNNNLERNPLIKIIPLYIKKLVLNYGFDAFGEDKKTMTLSNLGNIDMPNDMKPYINNAEVILYPTIKSPINCSIASINNKLTISFVRTIKENEVIRYFFRYLANNCGIKVQVYSNEWGVASDE